jgi:hypothetical protein
MAYGGNRDWSGASDMTILHEVVHLPNGQRGTKRWDVNPAWGIPMTVLLWLMTIMASVYTLLWFKRYFE